MAYLAPLSTQTVCPMSKSKSILYAFLAVVAAMALAALSVALLTFVIKVVVCLALGLVAFLATMFAVDRLEERVRLGAVIPFVVGVVVFAVFASAFESLVVFWAASCLAVLLANLTLAVMFGSKD